MEYQKHYAEIRESDHIIYSGSLATIKYQWDNLALSNKHGIFALIALAIDGKWYRLSWMQK